MKTLLQDIQESIAKYGGRTSTMHELMAENPKVYGYGQISYHKRLAYVCGNERKKDTTDRWSDEEIQILYDYMHLTSNEIAMKLRRRTPAAVSMKLSIVRKRVGFCHKLNRKVDKEAA